MDLLNSDNHELLKRYNSVLEIRIQNILKELYLAYEFKFEDMTVADKCNYLTLLKNSMSSSKLLADTDSKNYILEEHVPIKVAYVNLYKILFDSNNSNSYFNKLLNYKDDGAFYCADVNSEELELYDTLFKEKKLIKKLSKEISDVNSNVNYVAKFLDLIDSHDKISLSRRRY